MSPSVIILPIDDEVERYFLEEKRTVFYRDSNRSPSPPINSYNLEAYMSACRAMKAAGCIKTEQHESRATSDVREIHEVNLKSEKDSPDSPDTEQEDDPLASPQSPTQAEQDKEGDLPYSPKTPEGEQADLRQDPPYSPSPVDVKPQKKRHVFQRQAKITESEDEIEVLRRDMGIDETTPPRRSSDSSWQPSPPGSGRQTASPAGDATPPVLAKKSGKAKSKSASLSSEDDRSSLQKKLDAVAEDMKRLQKQVEAQQLRAAREQKGTSRGQVIDYNRYLANDPESKPKIVVEVTLSSDEDTVEARPQVGLIFSGDDLKTAKKAWEQQCSEPQAEVDEKTARNSVFRAMAFKEDRHERHQSVPTEEGKLLQLFEQAYHRSMVQRKELGLPRPTPDPADAAPFFLPRCEKDELFTTRKDLQLKVVVTGCPTNYEMIATAQAAVAALAGVRYWDVASRNITPEWPKNTPHRGRAPTSEAEFLVKVSPLYNILIKTSMYKATKTVEGFLAIVKTHEEATLAEKKWSAFKTGLRQPVRLKWAELLPPITGWLYASLPREDGRPRELVKYAASRNHVRYDIRSREDDWHPEKIDLKSEKRTKRKKKD